MPYFSVYHNPSLGIALDSKRGSLTKTLTKKKFKRDRNGLGQSLNTNVLPNIASAQADTLEGAEGDPLQELAKTTGFRNMSKGPTSPQLNTSLEQPSQRGTFDPAKSTIQDLTTIVDARKMRVHRENEVRKLHNRIQMLQLEEDRALRRIEETRKKAQ